MDQHVGARRSDELQLQYHSTLHADRNHQRPLGPDHARWLGRTVKTETGDANSTKSVVDTIYGYCACSPLGKVKQGYGVGYQNTRDDSPDGNGDQGHHFAAFFELGYLYPNAPGGFLAEAFEWGEALLGFKGPVRKISTWVW